MLDARHDEVAPLLGRVTDQALMTSLLDEAAERGWALVLRGEPGVGKSRLLSAAARDGGDRGMTVLTTTGVQSEAQLAFAGLHQLLRPVRDRAIELPAVQRAALDAAFGLTDEPAPSRFRIAMAVLDLVSNVATDAPLLVVVDDAHWLDRPTSDVLAFVARRIESDPIVLLAAIREGYPSALGEAGLPEHRVVALDEADAMALLDGSAPGLSAGVRTRVLQEAAGNPLAILELPAVVGGRDDEQWPAGSVPLTDRLERAFADRVSDLPGAARLLLLVAALSDEGRLDEILAASTAVAGVAVDLDVVEPAAEAGIVTADLQSIRFRHPLIRSAIVQSAGLAERRRVHAALADLLHDQPDRRAWHRAALLSGEHEDIALELEGAAARARRRGAGPVGSSSRRPASTPASAPSRRATT